MLLAKSDSNGNSRRQEKNAVPGHLRERNPPAQFRISSGGYDDTAAISQFCQNMRFIQAVRVVPDGLADACQLYRGLRQRLFVVAVGGGGKAPAAVRPVDGAGLLHHPPGGVIAPQEDLVQPIAQAALFLGPLVEAVVAVFHRRAGGFFLWPDREGFKNVGAVILVSIGRRDYTQSHILQTTTFSYQL